MRIRSGTSGLGGSLAFTARCLGALGRSGFLGAIGRQVLETIKPALMSALTAGITAKAATPDNQYQAPQPPPVEPPNATPGDPGTTPMPDDPSAAI